MHTATIRKAVEGDRDAIEVIAESAYARYIARMHKKPAPMSENYAKRIADGQVHVLEATGCRYGGVQGFLVLEPGTDGMLLDNVAVAPGCQGRGYGRALIDFAEETARAAGFDRLVLYTNEVMVENIRLYSRLGFAVTRAVCEHGFNRVYMSKHIS